MLRGEGSRGWFGPRVLWLCIGTASGLLAPWWGLIVTPIMFFSLLFMATLTDRWEWKNLLNYMSLMRAMNNGQVDGYSITEVRNADPES